MRDEFPPRIKELLSKRVGNRCSNPNCRQLTSGPQEDPNKALNIGVAAHITAASPAGPRFDPNLTNEKRKSPNNGIWLCQNCAKLVDNDPDRYPVNTLRSWKQSAESVALSEIEGGVVSQKQNHWKIKEKGVNSKWWESSDLRRTLEPQGYTFRWSDRDRIEERKQNGYNLIYQEDEVNRTKYVLKNKSGQVLIGKRAIPSGMRDKPEVIKLKSRHSLSILNQINDEGNKILTSPGVPGIQSVVSHPQYLADHLNIPLTEVLYYLDLFKEMDFLECDNYGGSIFGLSSKGRAFLIENMTEKST